MFEQYVFAYSSCVIDGRMTIDISDECAWHSLYTNMIKYVHFWVYKL